MPKTTYHLLDDILPSVIADMGHETIIERS
jgi:hypothetical protein